MDLSEYYELIETAQKVVLEPSLTSALPVFLISLINEILGVFPYALMIAGQLLFIGDALDFAFVIKLLVFVAVPVGIGGALGTFLLYGISYWGGQPLVKKYHKYLRFSWEDVENVSDRFQGKWYDEILFLALRSIPVLPSFPLTIAVGFLRMHIIPYFILTAAGFIIRMMITFFVVAIGLHSLSQITGLFYN